MLLDLTSVIAKPPRTTKPRTQQNQEAPEGAPGQFFDKLFGEPSAEEQANFANVEISPAEERRFGDEIVEAYLDGLRQRNLQLTNRGRDVEYLQKLVDVVRPFMTNKARYRRINVHVVDSPETDARSFPGGTLLFSTGLLDFAGSEAALVGIVGHELSHLDHGHQLAPLRRMKHFEQAMSGDAQGGSPQGMFSALRTMIEGFARPFRPEDESEADRDGAKWAFQAGYDSREMAELFLRLHRRDGKQGEAVIPFLQTHPFRLDRYRAIQDQFADMQQAAANDNLYVGKKNLSLRITRATQVFEEK